VRAPDRKFALPGALVLGAASAFAFEPVGWWPLMPVALAGLCELLLRAGSLRRALLIGWLFGLAQFVISLNWIATAFTFQAEMPSWLGWVAVVLLSLYLAVFPALAAGLAWRLGKGAHVPMLFALAGGWGVTEWLRAGIFTGFAWNPAGVTLAPTPLIESSALIGTYGLSMLVVLMGGLIWLEAHKKYVVGVLIALLTIILWMLPGSRVSETNIAAKAVRIVQPNIGQQDKWRPGFAAEAARRLAGLSAREQADASRRLIFWPEAAITEPLEDARSSEHQALAQFARTRAGSLVGPGDYLLTGGISLSANGGRVTGATNSVFVLGQGGQVLGRYDKAHLVPYGEYLPMRDLLSSIGLSRLAPGDVDFTPGRGARSIALPGWGTAGFQLCYEIIFSGHVVDRRNRPDFIFNPSNDAWFGSWGPPQHLAQARLRAAEEGIPVLRATPTGISAIIDARGTIVKSLPLGTAGVIDDLLPPASDRITPFGRAGNWIPLILALLMLIGAIALPKGQRYRRT
jgi:apolipoprotein N-acyltransferase